MALNDSVRFEDAPWPVKQSFVRAPEERLTVVPARG